MNRTYLYILCLLSISFQLFSAGVAQDHALTKLWFAAAQFGNLKNIEELVGNVPVNVQNVFGESALIVAISHKHDCIARFLLGVKEIDVNLQNNYGNTPLIWASYLGCENIVKLLLARTDIKVNTPNINGHTALIEACYSGHENIVKLLLEVPELDINHQSIKKHTALLAATKREYVDIVKLLLNSKYGVNVNTQNQFGDTPLMEAAYSGNLELTNLLLEVPGVDTNIQNNSGYTALMWAAEKGHHHIVDILLRIPGINIGSYNRHGYNAYCHAKMHNYSGIEILIHNKYTTLATRAVDALKAADIETFKEIVDQIGCNVADKNGNTLLHVACTLNAHEFIFFLLQKSNKPGELLNLRNKDGLLPLELIQPTSMLFKIFMELAYCTDETVTNLSLCKICGKKAEQFCSKCKKIYYCSKECQKTHWILHKTECKLTDSPTEKKSKR